MIRVRRFLLLRRVVRELGQVERQRAIAVADQRRLDGAQHVFGILAKPLREPLVVEVLRRAPAGVADVAAVAAVAYAGPRLARDGDQQQEEGQANFHVAQL